MVLGTMILLMLAVGIVGMVLNFIPVIGAIVNILLMTPFMMMALWVLYLALFPPLPVAATAPGPAYVQPPRVPPPPAESGDEDEGITLN